MIIWHIATKEDWHQFQKDNHYTPPTLKKDGFVHCAKADQLLLVANSFFREMKHLVLVKIDSTKLESNLKKEPSRETPFNSPDFPHIYGPLNLDAVEKTFDWSAGSDGKFELPDNLLR